MGNTIESLHNYLEELNDEYGGDVGFIPTTTIEKVRLFESGINWELPSVFKYFLSSESNGIIIGNRRIYSLFDSTQKKTFVDNLERNNDPSKSFWFKDRPHIFNDYLVIGSDKETCFCFSKKYNLENPSVYICENPNSKTGVDFDKLDIDLEGLIKTMIENEFGGFNN